MVLLCRLSGRGAEAHSAHTGSVMLRGNHPARIDDKGRLKIPNGFRTFVESQYGQELFVTSVTGEFVRALPDGGVARDRAQARGRAHRRIPRSSASSTASTSSARPCDRQAGPVVIPQILRETAAMAGEVSVLGLQNHLAVWNQKRLAGAAVQEGALHRRGRAALSEFGI